MTSACYGASHRSLAVACSLWLAGPVFAQGLPGGQGPGVPVSGFTASAPFTATGGTNAISAADRAAQFLSVKDFAGVDCTGATDSTTGLTAAGNASPYLGIPENCTLLVNSWNSLTASISINGAGPSSVIKHINSATGHMLVQTHANSFMSFTNLTIDGNYQNNGGDDASPYSSIRIVAGSTSQTNPAIMNLNNVTFINGGLTDGNTFWSAATYPYPMIWQEVNTRHLGGADGGEAVSFTAPMDAHFVNVDIDFQRTPSGAAAVGRAGILSFAGSDGTGVSSLTALGVHCNRIGQALTAALGCVDGYSGGDSFIVANSYSKNAYGRGFTTKADTKKIIISNSIVSNLSLVSGNASSRVGACFAVNAAPAGISTVGSDYTFANLQCVNTGGNGLFIQATTPNPTPVNSAPTVNITNLVVDGCTDSSSGSGNYALGLVNPVDVNIVGGEIRGCDLPIYMSSDNNYTQGPVTLSGMVIHSSGKPNIDANTRANKLWFAPLVMDTPFSASDLALTVTANAVQAWTPSVVIDTSSAAQTVSTVNGVPAGSSVSLSAASSANSLTLATGGNIGLPSPVYVKDTTSAMSLVNINGSLLVQGAAQASLMPFLSSSSAVVAQYADGTVTYGNARGTNAIDLQTCTRGAATQVASAADSVVIGCGNTASGVTAVAMGYVSIASGVAGMALGQRANDWGRTNCMSFASGRFVTSGDAQETKCLLRQTTAAASAVRLTTDAGAANGVNTYNLNNNSAVSFTAVLTAVDKTTSTKNYTASWGFGTSGPHLATRNANAASTLIDSVSTNVNPDATRSNGTLTGIAATVAADTTNGGLNFTFTPPTGNTDTFDVSVVVIGTEGQ